MMTSQKNYVRVATIYPYLMRSIRYDKWAEYLFKVVSSFVGKNIKVLELGAGNGRLAYYFKNYYPNIILSDISYDMLCQAEFHNLPKVCCDMKAIPFKRNFDLIYSVFDSVNYLTNKKMLLSLFKEIKATLKDRGIFTFDVSLEPNSLKHIKEPLRRGRYKGIRFVQKSQYNPKSRIHKNLFKMEKDKEIFLETHRQKIYPFKEYFQLLTKAELHILECYDAFSFKDGNAGCERVQFLVRS